MGRVRELTGDFDFCQRVREMGFGESAFVSKVGGRGPFICQVNGTRIALSHALPRRSENYAAGFFAQVVTNVRIFSRS